MTLLTFSEILHHSHFENQPVLVTCGTDDASGKLPF